MKKKYKDITVCKGCSTEQSNSVNSAALPEHLQLINLKLKLQIPPLTPEITDSVPTGGEQASPFYAAASSAFDL